MITPASHSVSRRMALSFLWLLAFLFSLCVAPARGDTGPGDWWMYQHDAQHSGRSSFTGASSPVFNWENAVGGNFTSNPVIGADGTLYVGSTDDNLYAFNADGSLQWAFPTGGAINNSPTIGADGTIYVASDDFYFYAVNPDGTFLWRVRADWMFNIASPVIGNNGTIYDITQVGTLFAIDKTGHKKWSYSPGWAIDDYSSPAIGADGTIYIGSTNGSAGNLYAYTDTGTSCKLKWTFPTTGWVWSSPAIGTDGTIYVGSANGNLYAITDNGTSYTQKWAFNTGGSIYNIPPVIGPDGTVYIGVAPYVYAVDPATGHEKWQTLISWDSIMYAIYAMTIGADGTSYVSSGGRIFTLDQNGNMLWSLPLNGNPPTIGPDGTLYITAGNLQAYVQGGAPSQLQFIQQPTNTSIGNTIQPAVTVQVLDAAGHDLLTATTAVTLAIGANPGGATLGGTLTVNAVNGVATFPDLTLDQPGIGYTLTAASPGLNRRYQYRLQCHACTAWRLVDVPSRSAAYRTQSGHRPGFPDAEVGLCHRKQHRFFAGLRGGRHHLYRVG